MVDIFPPGLKQRLYIGIELCLEPNPLYMTNGFHWTEISSSRCNMTTPKAANNSHSHEAVSFNILMKLNVVLI